jgi:hypothetical protein
MIFEVITMENISKKGDIGMKMEVTGFEHLHLHSDVSAQ